MNFPIRKLFWILTGGVILLLGIYTWNVMAWHVIPQGMPDYITTRFDIDGEANIPTWYSTVLLLSVSLSSFWIYALEKRETPKKPWLIFWFLFGCFYGFFSLDEAAVIHEILDQFFNNKWIVVYAPISTLFFLCCFLYFWFIRKGDACLRNWIIGGLIVYVAGALGCEWIAYHFDLTYALSRVEVVLEEGLELMGTIMVLMGCLCEINKYFPARAQMENKG